MSLRDEIKISQPPDQRYATETYGKENRKERQDLEAHIKEFLDSGGKVEEVPINVSKGTLRRFTIDLTKDVL